ncbi:3-beta-hydroxysteroid-Delta(8),Delta(7)-isomerase [Smittium mucronatum]|uniref:3-beta-hydroxysteroid-Delta(8), Delta(7)-isomerase n=1 Tax=Smittium mucronatum TaxID=133383 RepID=A0A1R0H3U2_9FUNG|nr:3-beta-hydroxysteroid-Delta(8),Delta(7)-isomerase [Smittium mucronatum]
MSHQTIIQEQVSQHPYYPKEAILDGYTASTRSSLEILVYLGLMIASVIATSIALTFRHSKKNSTDRSRIGSVDKFAVGWFAVCAFIHFCIEGYFVYNHKTLASQTGLFPDLWREYSLSDSRYLTSDPFTVIMEAITATFDTVMALLTVYGILNGSSFRHVAQFACSLAQLYGNVLYLSTNYFEGFKYTHPHGYYFWFYFVFMNSFWIFFPIFFAIHSWTHLTKAVSIADHVVYSNSQKPKSS